MMGLLTAVPAKVASLKKLTPKQNKAILWVWFYGLTKGYDTENIRWIVRQMIQESGWHGSPLLERNLNPFGMSCTNSTESTQKGCEFLSDGNTNAKYASIKAAVKDRFLWDEKRFTVPYANRQSVDYAESVCSRYFPGDPSAYAQAVGSVRYRESWFVLMVFLAIVPLEVFLVYRLFK